MSSQSTVKETRTVITSSSSGGQSKSSSGDGVNDDFYYRSSIAPRRSDVGHSSTISSVLGSPMSTGGIGGIKKVVEITTGMLPSGYANVSHTGVVTVKTHREQEKKDMQNLNERFANYIEKVRFLEAQNKKLSSELEELRSHWGKETSAIKTMYETELKEARRTIEDITKEKNKLEVKMQSLQSGLDDAHRQWKIK